MHHAAAHAARTNHVTSHGLLLKSLFATLAILLSGCASADGSSHPVSMLHMGGSLAQTSNKPKPNKPTFVVPAAPPKAATSTGAAFNAFINAHPTMRPYADSIWKWAGTYGVDKVVFAALLWKESFAVAAATGKDPSTIESPTKQGVGIGQINPNHVGEKTAWGATITQSDLTNPEFNIRLAASMFSQAYNTYGNYNDAYSKGYNPGYNGTPLLTGVPKTYVPRSGLSPAQSASVSVETSADRHAITDPWVVFDAKSGHLKYVNAANAPAHSVTYGGTPLTKSEFVKQWNQVYRDTWFAYTGRQAGASEIVKVLSQAPSVYTLANQLASRPSFIGSPVFKQHAPGLLEDAKQIMGGNWKPPKNFIATAIAQNWDQATFQAKLREMPSYANGPAFQKAYADMESQYESIYGRPDANAKQLITHVAQQNWTTDQFQSWLRTQPAYKNSGEYQANFGSFSGLIASQFGYSPGLNAQPPDQVQSTLSAGDSLQTPTAAPPAGVK